MLYLRNRIGIRKEFTVKHFTIFGILIIMAGRLHAGSLSGNFSGDVVITKNGISNSAGNPDATGGGLIVDTAGPHEIVGLVYFVPGSTLTIAPGVIFKSQNDSRLVITRGAQIYVNGTADEPVIMTSIHDDMENWRAACGEWGGLFILGDAHIAGAASETWTDYLGNLQHNDPCPINNQSTHEYLTPVENTEWHLYGGTNDEDNSGSIQYLSIRYAGFGEMDLLFLGGVGRNTEIHHIDIVNGVDDGIDIRGGTVNLQYINIWNAGDDSLNISRGWRGCAEYGLIVQGYSCVADQGSGIGDNCFETVGADDPTAHPNTTGTIRNFTVVGNPGGTYPGGDHGMDFRDDARMQYASCIWMDLGENLFRRNSAYNASDGTYNWLDFWQNPYSSWIDHSSATVNGCDYSPNALYVNNLDCFDFDKPLCHVSDSVFYNNLNASAYTEAITVDALAVDGGDDDFLPDPANGNVVIETTPISNLVHHTVDLLDAGGIDDHFSVRVIDFIDPMPVGEAKTKNAGGFTGTCNWLVPWTTAYAYGQTDSDCMDEPDVCQSDPCCLPEGIPGDINRDGIVDNLDLAILSANYLRDDNSTPSVDAGSNAAIYQELNGEAVITLDGTVTDDGKPENPGAVTLLWESVSDPCLPTPVFEDPTLEDPCVTFLATGTYTLLLTADDGKASTSDEVIITVLDYIPDCWRSPTQCYGDVDGDGMVTSSDIYIYFAFGGISLPRYYPDPGYSPCHDFDQDGDLDINDKNLVSGVLPFTAPADCVPSGTWPPFDLVNQPPSVDVGEDQELSTITGMVSTTLYPIVSDDDLPFPANLTYLWESISVDPCSPEISYPTHKIVMVTFYAEGTYVFKLTVDDGELSVSDEITINVVIPDNQPPTLDVSCSSSSALLENGTAVGVLCVTVTDDGLPLDPGNVTLLWESITAPGLTIVNPTIDDTRTVMYYEGDYTFRITAYDGEYTVFEDIIITVGENPFL